MTAFRLTKAIRLSVQAVAAITGDLAQDTGPGAATAFTLSGPTTGVNGVATTFTVTPNGALSSSVVVTPAATNAGSVSPTSLTFAAGSTAAQTFTVTRASDGASSVSIANNGGLSNLGTPITFTTVAGGTLASFELTTTNAGTATYPFYLCHPFGKGEVPNSITCSNLVDYRVVVLRTWNDGSAKHVMIVGRATLTQNTPVTVFMAAGTPPSSGTNLAQTDIPVGTYSIGISGATLTFSPRTDSPYYSRQTPVMSEFWFRQIDSATKMMGCMGVRVYVDGRVQCKPFIVNGRLDNGSGAKDTTITNRTFVPTFVVNGTTVFNNGGANYTMLVGQRIMGDNADDGWYWTNGSNPNITPSFDVDYLLSTKLVPMYGYGAPDNATLAALTQNYVLGSNGPLEADMGAQGGQFQIGPLTDADAKFLTSGDARAYRAVLCASSSLNSYNIANGYTADGNVLRLSTFGTWTQDGPGQGGSNNAGNSAYVWDIAHHGSGGYLAYMLTGDRWHYETMLLQMATAYLCVHSGAGTGVNRAMTGSDASSNAQVRGHSWTMRTLGQVAAIAPDAELGTGIAGEYRTLLVNNYDQLLARVHDGSPPRKLGFLHVREYGIWTQTGDLPLWQYNFGCVAHAMNSESDCVPDANYQTLERVRDFSYMAPIGALGGSGLAHEHDFVRGAAYAHKVADDNNGNGFAKNWGEVHLKNYGGLNTTATNTLQGDSGSNPATMGTTVDNYWAILSTAISYAAQHRAEGALTAYRRLHGASNWAAGEASFANGPKWGIKPRSLPAVSYTLPTTTNTSVLVGTNTARSIKPAGWTDGQFDLSTFWSFGGGVFVPWYGDAGAWVMWNPGGHNNQGLLATFGFDVATRTWFFLNNANGVALDSTPVQQSEASASPWYEMLEATSGQFPAPGHIYASHAALRRGNQGVVIAPTRGAMFDGANGGNFSSPSAHWVDLETGLATRACASANASSTIHVEGSSAYDPVDGRIYFTDSQFWNRQFISYIRLSDMTFQTLSLSGFPPGAVNYTKMVCIPERRVLVIVDATGALFGVDLTLTTPAITALVTGGPGFAGNSGSNSLVWNRRRGKIYQKWSSTGNSLNTITPPQTSAYGLTGQWDKGSVTIGGAGLPSRTLEQEHYTCLFDSEVTDCLGWIAGTTQQVALALI
jgi:hypothetical protein